jgi:hypothetical protein
MCELHSTRNEVKVVGVERLANEHILSGEKSAKINDKKQLTLDLSFLGKLEPESAKSKKTSSTKSTSSSSKKTSSNISNKDLNTWFEDDNSSDAVNETDGEEFNFLLE